MPLKATAAARAHRATASRVTSRRSAATIRPSRDASPVTIEAAEESQTRLARGALATTFCHSFLVVRAMTPRFVTRTSAAASISSPDAWHQAMTTANNVTAAPTKRTNTSAKSSREPVAAMTRASTSDPIRTPHDTAPGATKTYAHERPRGAPSPPPDDTRPGNRLELDNDVQATELDLGSTILDARVGSRTIDAPLPGHPSSSASCAPKELRTQEGQAVGKHPSATTTVVRPSQRCGHIGCVRVHG